MIRAFLTEDEEGRISMKRVLEVTNKNYKKSIKALIFTALQKKRMEYEVSIVEKVKTGDQTLEEYKQTKMKLKKARLYKSELEKMNDVKL